MHPILPRVALSLLLPLTAAAQSSHVEEGRLLEPVPEPGSSFGASVALSGGRIAVGDDDPTRNGQAFTYVPLAGLWKHDATAVALDGALGDRFGGRVALDGDTLVVGASTADVAGFTDAGAAYVFTRVGASWQQQQKFVAGAPRSQGLFGSSVAVSGDTLAIGAPQYDNNSTGRVDVYVRVGATWVFQQQLAPSGLSIGARAGSSISLQGERLAIGAPQQTVGPQNAVGQVFVFERSGNVWSEVAVIDSPAPIASGTFGSSVALDGGRLAVGAAGEPITNAFHGRVHLFTGGGASWSLEQTLAGTGTSTQNCAFGTSLALSGTRLAVGAPGHNNPGGNAAGTVKVYRHDGASWGQELDVYGHFASFGDQLGASVALKGDLLVGGAPNADVQSAPTRGEAYAFRLDPASPGNYCTAKVSSQGCLPSIGFSGAPSAGLPNPFLVTASLVINNKPGLLIYSGYYNQLPFQGGTLCVAAPIKRTPVQVSGGTPGPTNCSGTFSFDFNAHIQGGSDATLLPGKWIFAQYWYRDPASPSASGLTDALRFCIEP